MSEIPASQRPETKLETLDLAYDLRARITFELEQSFGYSQKILESGSMISSDICRWATGSTDPEASTG